MACASYILLRLRGTVICCETCWPALLTGLDLGLDYLVSLFYNLGYESPSLLAFCVVQFEGIRRIRRCHLAGGSVPLGLVPLRM